jgi:ribosomal protein S8E
MNKAHVTHPELKCTFCLEIIGIKKNPNGQAYTSLGVMTKGTIIEVNVSELGLVTPGGKIVWGKFAQVRGFFQYILSRQFMVILPSSMMTFDSLLCTLC